MTIDLTPRGENIVCRDKPAAFGAAQPQSSEPEDVSLRVVVSGFDTVVVWSECVAFLVRCLTRTILIEVVEEVLGQLYKFAAYLPEILDCIQQSRPRRYIGDKQTVPAAS